MNPWLFYTGKFAGYFIWLLIPLDIFGIELMGLYSLESLKIAGITVYTIGLLLAIVSLFHLGSSTRFGLPTDQTILKESGVYRFSRNPMYLGFNLMTMASVLYTLDPFIAILGMYCMIIYHRIILGEEKFLEARFGKAYLSFKSRIKRYFGYRPL